MHAHEAHSRLRWKNTIVLPPCLIADLTITKCTSIASYVFVTDLITFLLNPNDSYMFSTAQNELLRIRLWHQHKTNSWYGDDKWIATDRGFWNQYTLLHMQDPTNKYQQATMPTKKQNGVNNEHLEHCHVLCVRQATLYSDWKWYKPYISPSAIDNPLMCESRRPSKDDEKINDTFSMLSRIVHLMLKRKMFLVDISDIAKQADQIIIIHTFGSVHWRGIGISCFWCI